VESAGDQFYIDAKRAIPMLEEAISRDPEFVLAYCELAKWHDEIFFRRNVASREEMEENTADHRGLSEAALEKARRVQRNSGAVHLMLARHALQISNNAEEAEIQIQLARQALPNNSEVEMIAGRVARRMDRWDESLRCFEKAVSLEPRDLTLRALLANTYRFVRRYDDYDRVWGSMMARMPADKLATTPIERSLALLEKSADLKPLRDALAMQMAAHQVDEEDTATFQMMLALWSHDADGIDRVLARNPPPMGWNGVVYPNAWFEALAARIRGNNDAAVKAFAVARPEMEKRAFANPTEGLQLSVLAMIDAGLGRKEQAVLEARRAAELTTYKVNNFLAPTVSCHLAIVYAWNGQNDLAIAKLSELVKKPANGVGIAQPTYGDFRLNPLWDPLRNDPRFEALVQRLAPIASPE
jgi:tetratricopeptide (TPR) repeat protein